jgi:pilus assembly protein CpaB
MIKLSSRSSRFYLVISIAAAVLAAICLFAYLQGLRSHIAESGRLVQLVVAARDMDAGEVLDPSSLSLVDFPDIYMLPGTYTDILAVTGATLRSAIRTGEPLIESSLLPPGGGGLTLDALDRGFRAYPLTSSSVSFPAGELHAGNRVDILAISGDGAVALLENIEVLYVHGIPRYLAGDDALAASDDYVGECILLQVTCEEACRLAAAQESGKVELLLRAGEG